MLSFNNVYFSYNNNTILDNVSFEIENGEFAFLIGKSGVGKSTLLQMIYMNILPQMGNVRVDEYDSQNIKSKDLPFLRRKLGIIFQEFRLLKNRTVFENLAFILEVTGVSSREIKRRVNDVLTDVGLSHRKKAFPKELSGGEQQRIAIARAIINEPSLILADEPTGNLDPETSNEIVEILKRINSRGTAILFATHNYEFLKKSNFKILKIENGKVYKAVIKQKE